MNYDELNPKHKLVLFNLHNVGFMIATILGFVHGFVVHEDPSYLVSGWIMGISMLLMSGLGVYLVFQSGWQPFKEEQDKKYKTLRISKWILTLIMLLSLVWHYFPELI